MLILALLLAGSPAPLLPASTDAVIAGVQACEGTTITPQATATRFAGWQAVAPRFARTDGQTFARDQVVVTVSPDLRHPEHGACVVEARTDPVWKVSEFVAALGERFAARRQIALGRVILHLGNGEILIVTGAQRDGAQYVVLTLARVRGT